MLWKDQIREWKDEAREDGLEEGRIKTLIETARQLLKMNLGSVEQIASATQLSVDEVLKIKQEI